MPHEVFYNHKPRWEDCIPVDQLSEAHDIDDEIVDITTEELWKVQQAKVDSASGTDNSSDNNDDVDDGDNDDDFPDLSRLICFL